MTHRIAALVLSLASAVLLAGCGGGLTRAGLPDVGPPTRLAPASWTAQSPAGPVARWAADGCRRAPAGKQTCIERALTGLIDDAGIGKAMEVLDTLVVTDAEVRTNAHALAHGLGIAAYRSPETLASTFAACPPSQMSGCYHGVVQGYFLAVEAQGGEVGAAELDALCEPHRGNDFLFFQCAHGMGHGLTALHGHHLPMALEACDQAADAFVRENCYGGAFMENLVNFTHPHHTAEGHAGTQGHADASADAHAGHGTDAGDEHAGHGAAGHGGMAHGEWKALDRDDPLYPCTVVEARYRAQCYTMQSSAVIFFTNGDVAATARACERAPAAHVRACFQSLGRDITALAAQRHDRSLELCGRAAGTAEGNGETWCVEGVASNLVNLAADPDEGLAFCRRVTAGEAKEACYGAVGAAIASIVRAPGDRARRCDAAEPGFAAACRRGAAVEAEG